MHWIACGHGRLTVLPGRQDVHCRLAAGYTAGAILPVELTRSAPTCRGGRRVAPPEGCAGPRDYREGRDQHSRALPVGGILGGMIYGGLYSRQFLRRYLSPAPA